MDQQIVEREYITDTPDMENFKIIMLSQRSQILKNKKIKKKTYYRYSIYVEF